MIFLGFDIEEFDMPQEYGRDIDFEQQLQVSTSGTQKILELLQNETIKATFYCTANFALHRPDIIKQIVAAGHELASHGYYHSEYKTEHLAMSRNLLEELATTPVKGFRMPRMMPVPAAEIRKAGYEYNSSVNPTLLPGRYNNLHVPRTLFVEEGLVQLPASVSPAIRFPLFWLSFHNLPKGLYRLLCRWTLKKDGYLNMYFHPWEFEDITGYSFPSYVTRNSGSKMYQRLQGFIRWAKEKGETFETTAAGIDAICTSVSKNRE